MKTRRYFYLRFANCSEAVTNAARLLGQLRASGIGTAKNAKDGWLELLAFERFQTVAELRAMLTELSVSTEVVEVIEISRGEGKVQSQQLDLLAGLA